MLSEKLRLTTNPTSCKLVTLRVTRRSKEIKGIFMKKAIILFITIMLVLPGYIQAGTITGTITYEGKVPNFKPIKMDADPICMAKHTDAVYPELLVLGEGNTMANVFVRIKSGLPEKEYPAPEEPFVVNQAGCRYDPHVFGVMVGQPVKFLNPDGTLHNVHALTKVNEEFNMAMPKFRKEFVKTFDKVEDVFAIKCDVHPWMSSWCAVVDHPFFDVTEKDGVFTIEGLEPGTYEIEAWHEKLGTQTAKVTVDASGTQTSDFTFSRPS